MVWIPFVVMATIACMGAVACGRLMREIGRCQDIHKDLYRLIATLMDTSERLADEGGEANKAAVRDAIKDIDGWAKRVFNGEVDRL